MTATPQKAPYVPGSYVKQRPDYALTAEKYMEPLEKRRLAAASAKETSAEFPPTICFSRKIGVGALEIADKIAPKIGYRVADRLILERIVAKKDLSRKTVKIFDECYPGKLTELAVFLFGEKSFTMGDYTKALFGSVLTLAEDEPTIFVGRGSHLILPRERVLAVRCICSKAYRVKRLGTILKVPESEAVKKLDRADNEQREFYKKVFNRKDASPYEFDMVLNMDFIRAPESAAAIVAKAFRVQFKGEVPMSGVCA
jgi:hypothetical protein